MRDRLRRLIGLLASAAEPFRGLSGPLQSLLLPLLRLWKLALPLLGRLRGIAPLLARMKEPAKRWVQATKARIPQLHLPGTEKQRRTAWICVGTLVLLLEIAGCLIAAYASSTESGPKEAKAPKKRSGAQLYTENEQLQARINTQVPEGIYIVVDTSGNRVYMKRGQAILKEMVASCGSGNVLQSPGGGRKWVFDTPKGSFRVLSKVTNPVWVKPDWAFIEEGEPLPSDPARRAMPGMMGDFAIGIGDGYFIHGTLYSRLLGRNVSHGCVRLGDADLETLFRNTAIGTKVLIF